MSIDEGVEVGLHERSVPFTLTKQQYDEEERLGTAVTLATRAANRLALEMDSSAFQGGGPGDLVAAAPHQEDVDPLPKRPGEYGENTFAAVAAAYAHLQGNGHYGPFALVLRTEQFADAHAPLANTLIMPADRIRPLMNAGFYVSGALPARQGVMVSTGGNTVDVAIGMEPVAAFAQVDVAEVYRFRVYERFAVRIKVPNALVRLQFN